MPKSLALIAATLSCLLLRAPAQAWHDEGHVYAATAAVEALDDASGLPAFFRQGAGAVAHAALDPDLFKSSALPQLDDAEGPEHYLDIEFLRGNPLPPTRSEFIELCAEIDLPPSRVGLLPYAISEWTQRLTMALAEHRRDPDDAYIQHKALVYAGLLAHYAADLHMPLHTSVHYDGRLTDDGQSPHSGIHARVDALPTKLPYNALFTAPLEIQPIRGELFQAVVDELGRSHALVDRVYELEPQIPAHHAMEIQSEAIRALTRQRMRASAGFTAALFQHAWNRSAEIDPPSWLERDALAPDFDRDRIPPQP